VPSATSSATHSSWNSRLVNAAAAAAAAASHTY